MPRRKKASKSAMLAMNNVKVKVERLDEDIVNSYLHKQAETTKSKEEMEGFESDSSLNTVKYESSGEEEKETKSSDLSCNGELHTIKKASLKKKKLSNKNAKSSVFKLLKGYASKNTIPRNLTNDKLKFGVKNRSKKSQKSSENQNYYMRSFSLDKEPIVIAEDSNSDLTMDLVEDSNVMKIKSENLNSVSENVSLIKESSKGSPAQSEANIKIVNTYSIYTKTYQKEEVTESCSTSMKVEESNMKMDSIKIRDEVETDINVLGDVGKINNKMIINTNISDTVEKIDNKMETNSNISDTVERVDVKMETNVDEKNNKNFDCSYISAADIDHHSANCVMDLQSFATDLQLANNTSIDSSDAKNVPSVGKFHDASKEIEKVSPCLKCVQLRKNCEHLTTALVNYKNVIKKQQEAFRERCYQYDTELSFERRKSDFIILCQMNRLQRLLDSIKHQNFSPDSLTSSIEEMKEYLSDLSNPFESSHQQTHDRFCVKPNANKPKPYLEMQQVNHSFVESEAVSNQSVDNTLEKSLINPENISSSDPKQAAFQLLNPPANLQNQALSNQYSSLSSKSQLSSSPHLLHLNRESIQQTVSQSKTANESATYLQPQSSTKSQAHLQLVSANRQLYHSQLPIAINNRFSYTESTNRQPNSQHLYSVIQSAPMQKNEPHLQHTPVSGTQLKNYHKCPVSLQQTSQPLVSVQSTHSQEVHSFPSCSQTNCKDKKPVTEPSSIDISFSCSYQTCTTPSNQSPSNEIQSNDMNCLVPAVRNQPFVVGTSQSYKQSQPVQVQLPSTSRLSSASILQENFLNNSEGIVKNEPDVSNSQIPSLSHNLSLISRQNRSYSQTQPLQVTSSLPNRSSGMQQMFLNKSQTALINQQSFYNQQTVTQNKTQPITVSKNINNSRSQLIQNPPKISSLLQMTQQPLVSNDMGMTVANQQSDSNSQLRLQDQTTLSKSSQNINFSEPTRNQASAAVLKQPLPTSDRLFQQHYPTVSRILAVSQQQLCNPQPVLQNTAQSETENPGTSYKNFQPTAKRGTYFNQNLSNNFAVSVTNQQQANYSQLELQNEINKIITGQTVNYPQSQQTVQTLSSSSNNEPSHISLNQDSFLNETNRQPLTENETRLLAALPDLNFVQYRPIQVATSIPSLVLSPSYSSNSTDGTVKNQPSMGNGQMSSENETNHVGYPQSQAYLSVVNTCKVNLQ